MASPLPSLFLLLSFLTLLLSPPAYSNLFAEYIGAEFTGVQFTDVPINSGITNFQFILSFAIDYTTATPYTPTNGNFNVFWDSTNLGASQVAAIKSSNSNVKVAVSLGGATVGGNNVLFQPSSIDSWVANAVSSLTSLINQYDLDGIDIDYESFSTDADADTFAECIGQLITTLKNNGVIKFASIAPFPGVQEYYLALWNKYGSVIDQINFQFYAYDSSTTVSQFLSYYDTATSTYSGSNLLISFTTAGSGGLSPANGFFDAAQTLKSQGKLNGIFVWTADTSKSNGFLYDSEAQSLIVS